MRRRNIIEAAAVALVAAGLAAVPSLLRPVPVLRVGTDRWTTGWMTALESPAAQGTGVTDAFPSGTAHAQTIRDAAQVSIGGRGLRIHLSNLYGTSDLRLSRVTVAPLHADGTIDTGRLATLTFPVVPQVTVLPGTEVVSAPVRLPTVSGEDLAISLVVNGDSPAPTGHQFAGRTSWVTRPGTGDHADDAGGPDFGQPIPGTVWLSSIDVLDPPGSARDIVAVGDSLDDAYEFGAGAFGEGELTWPELLRRQLAGTATTTGIGVLNAGISGDTVTDVGCAPCGEAMVDREIRDAVNISGARAVIVLGGSNDLIHGAGAPAVIHGLASLAAVAHAHHLLAVGITLPPRNDASLGWVTATMEPAREAVNGWLRGSNAFDAVVDADRLLADPAHPDRLDGGVDRGDGTHLNAHGRAILAGAMPQGILTAP